MPEEHEPSTDRGKLLLSWTFPEYEKLERSVGWYVIAIIVAVALFVWSLVTQNYLFAVVIIIATLLLIRQHRGEPARLTFTIFEDGIDVANRHFYHFRELRTFWIAYDPPTTKKLFFTFSLGVRPHLTIPLEDTNPLTVREILNRFIVEDIEREDEPTSEALARLLKL